MNFGELFVVGFESTELTDDIAEKLKEINPAGVIFYDPNIESRDQVKKLISDLKDLLGEDLLIAVDQEGGKVQRLRKITTSLPSLQALGRASNNLGKEQDLLFAREPIIDHSRILATELIELGFNLVFAPCADISTNPLNPIIGTRSLGENAQIVSAQLKLIIETYRECGLLSCAKHFPGHGDTSIDSHLALPIQRYSQDEYLEHLRPFMAAVEANVDSVMVAHLISEVQQKSKLEAATYALDSEQVEDPKELGLKQMRVKKELPASISPRLIQEELRKSLGFKGLVVSDDVTMKALSKYGNYSEIAQKMLLAGNNLIVWNRYLDDPLQAVRYLNDKDDKKLTLAFQDSLEHINDIKSKCHPEEGKARRQDLMESEQKMLNIVKNAIRINKETNFTQAGDNITKSTAVLVADHPKMEIDIIKDVFKLDTFVMKEGLDLSSYENLLVLSFQTCNNLEQAELINKLREGKQTVIQASCDMPDDGAEIDIFGANRVHFEALNLIIAPN